MIAAVVPAAGLGIRFGLSDNVAAKQFLNLLGKPVYVWSVLSLSSHIEIDSVVLVLPSDSLTVVEVELERYLQPQAKGKMRLTGGGATRQESVFKGLQILQDNPPDYVLVHDAARPFLCQTLIDRSLKQVRTSGACTVGTLISDTVKRVESGLIKETIDRSELYLIQTPQCSRFDWLLSAHKLAQENQLCTTDDAAILEAAGHRVAIVEGPAYNLKLTKPADLKLAQALAPLFLEQYGTDRHPMDI